MKNSKIKERERQVIRRRREGKGDSLN